MGTTKRDKEFLWLTVMHLLEDMENEKSVSKKLKALNDKFYIKKRKLKD